MVNNFLSTDVVLCVRVARIFDEKHNLAAFLLVVVVEVVLTGKGVESRIRHKTGDVRAGIDVIPAVVGRAIAVTVLGSV
jgi:hypothetical protein